MIINIDESLNKTVKARLKTTEESKAVINLIKIKLPLLLKKSLLQENDLLVKQETRAVDHYRSSTLAPVY
jgi:hypothetical protein